MDTIIGTPKHYTNKYFNDTAFKYTYFNMEFGPPLQRSPLPPCYYYYLFFIFFYNILVLGMYEPIHCV